MKQFKIILGLVLFATVSTFAQSPRIKLNQITKDTVKGSVLISSPTDSGMVYSRDFYIAYGADTLLILYGDTIGGVGGGVNSIVVDPITLNGNGTTASPLSVDTATVISTIQGLVDSLLNYVTTNTTQTISGAKTFTNTITQSGGDANFDSGTLFVDESENRVGIGTTSPSSILDINGGYLKVTSNGRKFSFYEDDVSAGDGVFEVLNATGTANVFKPVFNVTSNDASSTYASGFVFQTKTDNVGNGPVVEFMARQNGTTVVNRDLFRFSNYLSTGTSSSALTIKANEDVVIPSGNVGIGTTSPSETLDVNGNGRFRSIGSGASVGALHYTSTGVLTTNTSDVRLKTNLQPLENTLNKLLDINTYTFNWINETDRVDLGMVAQEVEQIFPNLVFTNNVDGYKGIHYDKFSSILTKAIQEQQAIIETQQTEIDQLKTLITDLTNRLIILENK